ncbi:hypothetical protein [Alkalihalobacillus sp. AL-G]|uniref:hypothetical protein n=1 Tax=Alkalihalobacillus sp. AL-G TaxID=2926399 RepID=UPI00272D255B|nr:hypothetical protein [Alkalihalobacillus sp. AL-G]WLD91728.1 hypothetical protein MOJ78_11805 [Alkalihalobacillus sp. AL-G]
MSEKEFNKLKKDLDQDIYGEIRFLNNEKQKVLHSLTTKNPASNQFLKRIFYSTATVILLFGLGAVLLNEGIGSNPDQSAVAPDISKNDDGNNNPSNDTPTNAASDDQPTNDAGLDKNWKDVTDVGTVPDHETNSAKKLIRINNEMLHAPVPEQYDDEMYYRAMGSHILRGSIWYIDVEGEAIEKDFENIKNLTIVIHMEEKERYEHLDLPKGEWPQAHVDQWKQPSERMKTAMRYLKGILNDLDIAINKNDGEILGYAHMVDGKKAADIENFIHEEELVEFWLPAIEEEKKK